MIPRPVLLPIFLCLAACAPAAVPGPTALTLPPPSPVFTSSPLPATHTREAPPEDPSETPVPAAPSATASPAPRLEVCSPLAGQALSGWADAVTNPFHPPAFGSDDPHQGLDLAVFLPGTRIGISGGQVQAVLGGVAVMAVTDLFPYGNALMIETPLEALLQAGLELPAEDPATPVRSALTCPGQLQLSGDGAGRSLYLLYAHFRDAPTAAAGDPIACGSPIGLTGDTGNALNPHLHLEARVGPAGVVFPPLGHYTGAASPEQMDAYCAWRIGGMFRPIDPGIILSYSE